MIPSGKVLFRAKSKETREWVYGIPLYDWGPCSLHCPNQHQGQILGFLGWIDQLHEYGKVEVDPDTVCMYVWTEDKNGTPIFTGDIVERVFNKHVLINGQPSIELEIFKGTVMWSESAAITSGRWVLEGVDEKVGQTVQIPLSIRGNNTCTVLGSIYDKP